jgi:hypothetical protein
MACARVEMRVEIGSGAERGAAIVGAMSTFDDAERIALALPRTDRVRNEFRVAGKSFVAAYPERVPGARSRVPNFTVLVVYVEDLHTKHALLAQDPDTYFTTDHYDDYPIVLARLERLDEELLTRLVTEAWASRAPASNRPGDTTRP